jgi:hypothetical protein
MHDLNRILFYRTSFDIKASPSQENPDIIWSILCSVRKWKGKHLPKESKSWSPLAKNKGELKSEDLHHQIHIKSDRFFDEEHGDKWACTIIEEQEERGRARRTWRTELCFSFEAEQSGTFTIVLSYENQSEFVGMLQKPPTPNIPNIIKILAENKYLECTVSGKELPLAPKNLRSEEFPEFLNFLEDQRRDTPVLFISPVFFGKGEDANCTFAVDPKKMAEENLGPCAFVYYSDEQAFMEKMKNSLPDKRLCCTNGTIRVYSPHASLSTPWHHRSINPWDETSYSSRGGDEQCCDSEVDKENEEDQGFREDELLALFRRALAQNTQPYGKKAARPDDVKSLIRRSTFENRWKGLVSQAQADTAAAEQRADAADKTAADAQSAADKQEQNLWNEFGEELDTLEHENSELKKRLRSVESERDYYKDTFANKPASRQELFSLGKYPSRPKGVVELFLKTYPQCIDLTDHAHDSLKNCPTEAGIVWDAMHYICELLYPLWKSEESTSLEQEFNQRAEGFEFARTEGKQTKKDKKLMATRKDTYDGREITAMKHIKKGNFKGDKSKSTRVYLELDNESGKILILHVGEHLPNYSTRKQ